MSWNDILVFADGSENGLARARMAAALAQEHGARLEVCIPALMPAPVHGAGEPLIQDMADAAAKLARDDAGRAREAVRASVPELGERLVIEAPEMLLSHAHELAAGLARASDLVVLGQPIAEDASALDAALFEGALMESGRPCLMLPRWTDPRPLGRRVLVAWTGAREAARAAHDALPLLARAESVRVFHVATGGERAGEGPLGLARITSHLARQGARVEEPVHETARGGAGEAILTAASAWAADLIVMGGYGHSRAREFVFGGATRTLIRSSPVAALFSH